MTFAIKAGIADLTARTFTFTKAKTMYGGRKIAAGDFLFASENEGGPGLIARGLSEETAAFLRRFF